LVFGTDPEAANSAHQQTFKVLVFGQMLFEQTDKVTPTRESLESPPELGV
jgi:hypothetical protein